MKENLFDNIIIAYENTKEMFKNGISSEKTFVFKFSIELDRLYKRESIFIDFEYKAYEDISNSDKYLDLLIYDINNEKVKYAIEFKAPTKSGRGNSNQTVTRKKIYKDIARLKYLKEKKVVEAGFFLMLTDEEPYINKSNRRDNTYDTSEGHRGNLSNFLRDYNIKNEAFTFEWEKKGIYYWLKKPIVIN